MKLIKVEYTDKTSQGIYANVTYKNLFGKVKTREVFLYVYNYERKFYSPIANWVDSGRTAGGMYSHTTIVNEVIRQYELNNK